MNLELPEKEKISKNRIIIYKECKFSVKHLVKKWNMV